MSDVYVKDGCMRGCMPMNGKSYTSVEWFHYVGTREPVIVNAGLKALVYDGDGNAKGKIPNGIATGWLRQDGDVDNVVYGPAMLIDRKHIM